MSDEEDSTLNNPCHGQPAMADSCNRQPFMSDDDCERGEVDIHQFDDLPYCGPTDLTIPEIPPETSDIVPPTVLPVPCSCINIDYKLDFKGYTDEFNSKVEFKSIEDCCAGEYETDFEFELPCPIGDDFKPRKFEASLSWDCDTEFSQEYIKKKEDECGLDASDIKFCMGLPCPVGTVGDGEDIYDSDPYNDLIMHSNLNGWEGDHRFVGLVEISDKVGPVTYLDFEGHFLLVGIRHESGIIVESPYFGGVSFKLKGKRISLVAMRSYLASKGVLRGIPAGRTPADNNEWSSAQVKDDRAGEPGDESSKPGNIRIDVNWAGIKNGVATDSARFVEINEEECEINADAPNLSLDVPCPIPDVTKKFKAKLGWNCPQEKEDVYFKRRAGECEIEPSDIDFKIGLPCPIQGDDECKITIGLDWKNEDRKQTQTYLTSKKDAECSEDEEGGGKGECEITPISPEFNLGLPCPIPFDAEKKITASLGWNCGNSQSMAYIRKKPGECELETKDIDLNIGLPCPIKGDEEGKITINLDWKDKKKDTQTYIKGRNEKSCGSDKNDGGTCEIETISPEFDLGLPCPIPDKEAKVKVEIDWDDDKTKKKGETVVLKKKKDECEIEVPEPEPIELALPCPIPEGQAETRLYLDWNASDTSATLHPVKKKDGSDCEIEFQEEEYTIGLPCPIPEGQSEATITINWDEINSATFTPIKKGADCELEFQDEDITIGLPCPIPDQDVMVKAKIEWTDETDKTEAEAKIFGKGSDCSIDANAETLELGLPCPIQEGQAETRLYLDWNASETSATLHPVKKKDGSCEIEFQEEEYTIGLPCPVSGLQSSMTINLAWDYSPSATEPLIRSDPDCSLTADSPTFNIGLPCPLKDVDASVTMELEWDAEPKVTKSILKSGGDCSLSSESVDFKLGLPCPIEGNYARLKIDVEYGDSFEGVYGILVDNTKEGCKAELRDWEAEEHKITIPCPLDNLKIEGDVAEGNPDCDGVWTIDVNEEDESEECSKSFTVKLTTPKKECITVITGVSFTMPTFTFETKEICGRFDSVEEGTSIQTELPTTGHVNKCC